MCLKFSLVYKYSCVGWRNKFQYVTKVQPKHWKHKTESNFSAWHYLTCGVCAPPGSAIWKWETSSLELHTWDDVVLPGSDKGERLGLARKGRRLHQGHHTFSCLHSSMAALAPWGSAAQSGQHRTRILSMCNTVRESRREAMLLHRRPELPPPSARIVGSRWKDHEIRQYWDKETRLWRRRT